MRTLFLAATAVLALGACNKNTPNDRLDDNQAAANSSSGPAALTPAKRCASTRTYDLMKHELFRRAAQLRGKDDAIFDRLAAGAALRVERPVVKSQDEGLGSIACAASIALDLPPELAVAGGRSTLVADLEYTLLPAADGSGDVVTITNADAITVPLATLGRSGGGAAPAQPTPQSFPPRPAASTTPPPLYPERPSASVPPARLGPPPVPSPQMPTSGSGNPEWRMSGTQRDQGLSTRMYVDLNSLRRAGTGQLRVWIRYVGIEDGRTPVQTFTLESVNCYNNTHMQLDYYVRNAQGRIVSRRGPQPNRRILPDSMLMGQMDFICGAGSMEHL